MAKVKVRQTKTKKNISEVSMKTSESVRKGLIQASTGFVMLSTSIMYTLLSFYAGFMIYRLSLQHAYVLRIFETHRFNMTTEMLQGICAVFAIGSVIFHLTSNAHNFSVRGIGEMLVSMMVLGGLLVVSSIASLIIPPLSFQTLSLFAFIAWLGIDTLADFTPKKLNEEEE